MATCSSPLWRDNEKTASTHGLKVSASRTVVRERITTGKGRIRTLVRGISINGLSIVCCLLLSSEVAQAQLEFEAEPINYQTAPVHDRIARLVSELDAGDRQLTWDARHGWLPSLLDALQVPVSSQTLVFSKTSLQLSRITPLRPRALYFNDDTYVGWVQRGDVVELAAVDDRQGTVFYTLKQEAGASPDFRRDQGQCTVCHASSRTMGVPGLLVRSVYPARDGQPHFGLGTLTTSHRTPFDERFGGWYVTGSHGDMRHRGNAIAKDNRTEPIDPEPGANLKTLDELFRTQPYLAPDSDLVALMVLEYQSQAHNAMTRAGFETRRALHYDAVMNKALERPADYRSESTDRRIASAGEELLQYLFYSGEARLTSPVSGTTRFVEEFSREARRDSNEQSLRDFDLQTRLFRHPCSYLIYSAAYESLPPEMLEYVERRIVEILSGHDVSPEFSHLTDDHRSTIRHILIDTHPRLGEKLLNRGAAGQ